MEPYQARSVAGVPHMNKQITYHAEIDDKLVRGQRHAGFYYRLVLSAGEHLNFCV